MNKLFLDAKNFTISSDDWQIQEALGIVNGKRVSIKIKINPEGDVWEYVSGMPVSYIGQQLFTFSAALRETSKVGKSLPIDISFFEQTIESIEGTTQIQKYKNYLTTFKIKFVGCYSSGSHIFDDIGDWSYYRLDDGTRLALSANTRNVARRDETMGYLVMVK